MNPYLSVSDFREHAPGTAIGDTAIQSIMDDVADEIDDRFGPIAPVTEIFRPGWSSALILRRKAASITSVTEYLGPILDDAETRLLAADDYLLEPPYRLLRLRSGTTPALSWASYGVAVVYVPRDDSVRRKMAIVDVTKLELAHSGYASLRVGDFAVSKGGGAQGADDFTAERTKILRARLAPRRGFVMR